MILTVLGREGNIKDKSRSYKLSLLKFILTMMKRQTLNFVVDALALAGFVFLMATGLFLHYILPPGSNKSLSVWGLTRHEWGDIHFYIAVFIIAVLSLHLVLHWRWIVCAIQSKPKEGSGARVALGVAGLITLLLIAAAPFLSPTEKSVSDGRNQNQQQSHSKNRQGKSIEVSNIGGSMTLAELEQMTDVPIHYILKELGIPGDVSPDQKLGILRKKYDFEMGTVRKIISSYLDDAVGDGGDREVIP